MKRSIFGVVLGVVVGVLVFYLMELTGGGIYPETSSMPLPQDAETVKQFYHDASPGYWIWILISFITSALIAGVTAAAIDKDNKAIVSVITGVLLIPLAIWNMTMHFHPLFIWIAGLIQFIPIAYIGSTMISSESRSNKHTAQPQHS